MTKLDPKFLAQRDAIIRDAHARGLNDSEIVKELNLTRQIVSSTRRRLGLPSNRKHYERVSEGIDGRWFGSQEKSDVALEFAKAMDGRCFEDIPEDQRVADQRTRDISSTSSSVSALSFLDLPPRASGNKRSTSKA